MTSIRVAAAQINTVVGDLEGNVARATAAYEAAQRRQADLVVFPELTLSGYPPEDLLMRPRFVAEVHESLEKFAADTGELVAIVGYPEAGRDLYNSAAVCQAGKVQGVYRKRLLPNYAVFDEQRYFAPGDGEHHLYTIAGVRVGVSICEDAWSPTGAIAAQAAGGAELCVNLNASPFYARRLRERETMLATRAADASVPILYCNLVGGQDELVFDGASLVFDESGALIARGAQFVEDLLVVDVEVRGAFRQRRLDPRGRRRGALLATTHVSGARPAPVDAIEPRVEPVLPAVREVWEALVLGTRDYVDKNGFERVLIALSGGIDSALVTTIAVDALGPDRVVCVMMPSRYSSKGSVADSEALVARLGCESMTVPIEPAHTSFEAMLAPAFAGTEPGVAEENLQARVRGTVMMALSNKHGWLVLTTGNKSEMATGYATLYGDMAGGFAVIKDVPKTLAYLLARDRNERAGTDRIPVAIIDKPPSAELRPDQRDTDSLPTYDVLDPVIEGYVELDRSAQELVEAGHDAEVVRRVTQLVDRNEYKRRQAPPGIRVSPKAFGKDRRLPITSRWSG